MSRSSFRPSRSNKGQITAKSVAAKAPKGRTSRSATSAVPGTPPGLTRGKVSTLLGISKTQLRRLEARVQPAQVGPKRVRMFSGEQVDALIMSRRRTMRGGGEAGELAADAFAAFDAGTHAADVVKQLRIEPKRVIALQEQWAAMRGLLLVTNTARKRLEKMLGAPIDPTSDDQLLDTVAGRIRQNEELRSAVNQLQRELVGARQASQALPQQLMRAMVEGFQPEPPRR